MEYRINDLDFDNPDEVLRMIEQGVKIDPELADSGPWQGFVLIQSFDDGNSVHEIHRFDGILAAPAGFSMWNPVLDDDLLCHFREITAHPVRGPWRTWLMVYNRQTDTFDNTFLWPGEDEKWNGLDGRISLEQINTLNPVDASVLDAPFSAKAASWLYSIYRIRENLSFCIHTKQQIEQRLTGGWRLVSRDSAETGPFILVADNTAVTYTEQPQESHESILADLNAT